MPVLMRKNYVPLQCRSCQELPTRKSGIADTAGGSGIASCPLGPHRLSLRGWSKYVADLYRY